MIILLIVLYIYIIVYCKDSLSHCSPRFFTFLFPHMRKTRYLSLYVWLIWISMTSVYLHIPPHGVIVSVITTEQNSTAHI